MTRCATVRPSAPGAAKPARSSAVRHSHSAFRSRADNTSPTTASRAHGSLTRQDLAGHRGADRHVLNEVPHRPALARCWQLPTIFTDRLEAPPNLGMSTV